MKSWCHRPGPCLSSATITPVLVEVGERAVCRLCLIHDLALATRRTEGDALL